MKTHTFITGVSVRKGNMIQIVIPNHAVKVMVEVAVECIFPRHHISERIYIFHICFDFTLHALLRHIFDLGIYLTRLYTPYIPGIYLTRLYIPYSPGIYSSRVNIPAYILDFTLHRFRTVPPPRHVVVSNALQWLSIVYRDTEIQTLLQKQCFPNHSG